MHLPDNLTYKVNCFFSSSHNQFQTIRIESESDGDGDDDGDGDGDEQEIEDMIVTVDKNKDGKINYSEFRVGKIKSIKLHIWLSRVAIFLY